MSNLPEPPASKKSSKKKGCFIAFTILGCIFVLLVGLHFAAPSILTSVANKQLPGQLETESSLGSTRVNLFTGNFGLSDLSISQPEGFGEGEMLRMGSLSVSAPVSKALRRNPVVVRRVHLDGLDLHLISNGEQVLNVTRLGIRTPEEEEDKAGETAPPPVWVEEILLENLNLLFTDLALDWKIELSDIRFELHNLQMEYDSAKGPGRIQGEIGLKSPKADGQLRLHGKVGTITPTNPEQVPPLQLAIALIGFDLDLISPFLDPSPTVAKTAFGGSGFDLILFMEISPGESPESQVIAGTYMLETDGGHIIANPVGGTLAKPDLPFMGIFADILGNQLGRVTQLGENIARGGLEAGKAVTDTGTAAVKGAGKAVTGLAGGAFRTLKGVATLDKDEAVGGMKDATVGTAGNVAGTVTDTVGAAGRGLGSTIKVVRGKDQIEKWWAEVDERKSAFDQQAKAWFTENPFPESHN
ncbi:MAG: hypothetical protein WD708_12405 [Kiritimatiellia bacterium]